MEAVKKRYFLSSSETKALIKEAYEKGFLSRKDFERIEAIELHNNDKLLILDGLPLLNIVEGVLVPTLFNPRIKELPFFKVDAGAVPHILNGADVMAPGVIEYPEQIFEGMISAVKAPNEEYIAIAKVLEDPLNKLKARKGRLLMNLHYKQDQLYSLAVEFLRKKLRK